MSRITDFEVESKLRRLLADGEWHDAETVNAAVREGGAHVLTFEITDAVRRIGGTSRTHVDRRHFSHGYLLAGWQENATTEYQVPSA